MKDHIQAAIDRLAGLETAQGGEAEREVVALFDRFRVPLLRYLLSLRVPQAESEEIVQEAFLQLHRHLGDGKSRANLPGWLFTVVHRLGWKHRLSARRRGSGEMEAAADHRSPGPQERLEMIERRERLLAVIDALSAQDRQCLALRAEGLRYREIAAALGISLGSVAASMARALAKLNRVAGF